MRAAIYNLFGSGEAPSISLPTVYEMGMLPPKWEAIKRVVDFFGAIDGNE